MELVARDLLHSLLKFRRINYNDTVLKDLNLSQIGVLLTLAEYSQNEDNKMMIMSKLSNLCNMTRPALTQIINRLEKNGYVKRSLSPDNRREVLVTITEQGLEIVEEEKKLILNFFEKVVDELGIEDTNKFIELLDKFYLLINNEKDKV